MAALNIALHPAASMFQRIGLAALAFSCVCRCGVHGSINSPHTPTYKNSADGKASRSSHRDTKENASSVIYHDYQSSGPDAGPCEDLRVECAAYAAAGGCTQDPRWMHPHCPAACAVCEQRVQVLPRSQGFGQRNVVHPGDIRDAVTHEILGVVPQRLVPGHEDAIRERIERTADYMERVVMVNDRYSSVRGTCRTLHTDCAFWSTLGECKSNEEFMTVQCAPVCFACEQLHVEAKCPIDPNEKHAWYPGDLNKMFEHIVSDSFYAANYEIEVLSRPDYAEGDDVETSSYQLGPWVLTLDNFLSPEEAEALVNLGAEIGYERSTDVGELEADGSMERVVSEWRTSTNAWCNTDKCNEDSVALSIYDRIQNLTQIPSANSEPFQMLRYEPGQRYGEHHDYISYEIKRKHGVRILTVFLYLNDVDDGGATNFPKLNLTVVPKVGRALVWPSTLNNYPNAPDERTEHQALPVEKGIKYGANAWLHQRQIDDECDP